MTNWFQIVPGSDQPIYEQIVRQVETAVARSELRPGDKLPPVRRLAEDLVVNPNTVAKAYRLMEMNGLVDTRRGAGTFVTDPNLRNPDARNLNLLAERIDNVIGRAIALGMTPDEVRNLFEQHLHGFADAGSSTVPAPTGPGPRPGPDASPESPLAPESSGPGEEEDAPPPDPVPEQPDKEPRP